MRFEELLLIAVALSMDAFAASVCKGLSVRSVKFADAFKAGLWFGGFQALMPLAGYYFGVNFASFVSSIDHWIAFFLLAGIGLNMVKESLDKESCNIDADFSAKAMLPIAVATSIDALAVGVSFAFLNVGILPAASCIGVVTALFSIAGVYIGKQFGCRYKSMAEFTGGVILVLMGIKILVEHLVG